VRSVHYTDRDGKTTDYVLDFQYTYDLVVFFPYNSVELTGRAKDELAALGRALQSPQLRPYRYMIAGHTDSVGSPEYNRDLSIRRAEVVARYLLDNFDIDPRRLVSTGWGATEPRDPQNPDSGVNRRVEVVMIVDPAMAPAAYEGAPPFRSGPPPAAYQGAPPFRSGPPPERLGTSGPCDPNAVRENAGRPGTLDDFEGCDGRFDQPMPAPETMARPPMTGGPMMGRPPIGARGGAMLPPMGAPGRRLPGASGPAAASGPPAIVGPGGSEAAPRMGIPSGPTQAPGSAAPPQMPGTPPAPAMLNGPTQNNPAEPSTAAPPTKAAEGGNISEGEPKLVDEKGPEPPPR
jgi:hypothetical protein